MFIYCDTFYKKTTDPFRECKIQYIVQLSHFSLLTFILLISNNVESNLNYKHNGSIFERYVRI